MKIKLVLIGIVVVSFVVFGVVSGTFVKKQYISYTLDNLKERIYSVETEAQQKLGGRDTLDAEILGPYMQYILQKFSAVFVTDINLYNLDGELLASSQPSIYEKGISAEQMNPMAFHAFNSKKKSEFIHTEKIGKLSYLAAYLPFINNKGTPLGYLNLQHFSKQNTYENQISGFLITIINIGVLLLVITVIIAIFVSTWITTPLRLIQQNFKTVELGKANKPIAYDSDDEIGALVKDYNNKLAELELKAMQLARSERETAWREMAKQVAHEIKNPLTPMKLVLQHFQRSYDPKSADAPEQLQRFVKLLIEQIDTLTKIANEFSDFAKMPKANEEEIDLLPLIKNCLDLYNTNENDIKFSTKCSEITVFADKDLMIRVFNNILKNALQAIPSDRKPSIGIEISHERKGYLIAISDNGIGINPQEKNKIFVPNFTTKSTGAGIGLAMVKQIIQNHNGEIWFDSVPKKGTTFYIYLPGISVVNPS